MDNLQLNTGLIEAFGELERLCNQIYGTQHGVTSYIDEMRSFGVHGSYRIANWNDNLSRLPSATSATSFLTAKFHFSLFGQVSRTSYSLAGLKK